MTIPSRTELLTEIDNRFRARFPNAPEHLQTGNPAHAEMIQWWHQFHNDVLYAWTDSVFFSYFPAAPKRLDPSNPEHSTMIDYWNDIAAQMRDGTPGKHDWSGSPDTAATAAADDTEEEPATPAQDGSVGLERAIEHIQTMLHFYLEVLDGTGLAADATDHVNTQIATLRGLVKDGAFTTYSVWWRSPEFDKYAYEDDDPMKEEIGSIKDLTVEAKIDRTTGELDTHLAGWAKKKGGNYFGRTSRASE
jgi:hypothetical protein